MLIALLGVAAAAAHAEVVPRSGDGDARLRSLTYDPKQVIRLQGYVGYQIDLEFAPGEHFVNLAAGDTAAIDVGAIEHHLMIKPRAPLTGTNITIFTNRRVYHLQYRATRSAPNAATEEVIYAVRFIYPQDTVESATANAFGTEFEHSVYARPRNLRYDYCGPRTLRPVSVYDDGVQTHLTFPPRADIPAIFVSDAAGAESLANFHVESESVVVHQIAPRFVLRRGRLVACLVNRGFDGGGAALDTRTLAPGVVRKVREPAQ